MIREMWKAFKMRTLSKKLGQLSRATRHRSRSKMKKQRIITRLRLNSTAGKTYSTSRQLTSKVKNIVDKPKISPFLTPVIAR